MTYLNRSLKNCNMERNHDLDKTEGIKKLREIVGHSSVCMMSTDLANIPANVRPMDAQEIDDQGNFWFFSSITSTNYKDIEKDNRVQLIFKNEGKQEYASVYGLATFSIDKKRIDELWSSFNNAWYDGKDDPNLILIKLDPKEAYYWDRNNNKLVSLFKMVSAAVTGKNAEDVIEKGAIKTE